MKKQIAIIGGGIAGLALSIDLCKRGIDVILIEKGSYPRHKVCGEYVAMESKRYLEFICPELSKTLVPEINIFKLSATGSGFYETALDPGGFGISRYKLEMMLYNQALEQGVTIWLNCKANEINADKFNGQFTIKTSRGAVNANLICNASGRKSNFESGNTASYQNGVNYVGVKYHVQMDRDSKVIEIHNFPGGYCGISSIEDNLSSLCYIVNSQMLKTAGNSIKRLEKTILSKNKQLEKIFHSSTFKDPQPLTISGINFLIKNPVSPDVIFLGDSAGSIAPITGNGMSMALRSAATLAEIIDHYLSNNLSSNYVRKAYSSFWNKEFSKRIKLSRYFQRLSESSSLTNFTIQILNTFPALGKQLIKQTHGRPF